MIARLARWRHILLVLALATLHMFVWERGLAGDGWGYFSTLESMIEDHDLDLTNNRYGVTNGLSYHSETQQWVAQYPPGLALFDAPFYLLGKLAYRTGLVRPAIDPGKMRPAYEKVGQETLTLILFVVLAHNVYAALAIILIYATLRRLRFPAGWAALVAGLSFFGSPLHFYAQNGMSHAVSCFAAAATARVLAGLCMTPEGRARRWVWLGVTVGAGAVVRYASALLSVAVGLVLLVLERRRPGRLIGMGLLYSAGLFAVIWILPVYLKLQIGDWFGSTYSPKWNFDPAAPPLVNVLFAARHGFLWYHPLYWLAFPGIAVALLARKRADPAGAARALMSGAGLAALLALGLIYGYWFAWWGGDSYSQRFLTDAVPFLACPLAVFLTGGRPALRVSFAIALVAISYVFFLLSNAGLVYDVVPQGPGQTISDYRYVLDQGMSAGEIGRRLREASFTLPILQRFLAAVAAGAALVIGGYLWLGTVSARHDGGPGRPARRET
ncbi:MAG: glycosyltransferase family 39 protein [Myxococcota bacterium]